MEGFGATLNFEQSLVSLDEGFSLQQEDPLTIVNNLSELLEMTDAEFEQALASVSQGDLESNTAAFVVSDDISTQTSGDLITGLDGTLVVGQTLSTLRSLTTIHEGGNSWGSGNYATSIAFGDVDGDGRDEVGVARRAGGNGRYFIFEDALSNFSLLHQGGNSWGSNNYATSIAFGDVDGDGRDEVGVSRRAGVNARYFILEDELSGFSQIHEGGNSWGSNNYATSIAFGDVDGDGRDEVGVARRAGVNARYFILEDELSGFSQIHEGGNSWGSNNYATSIAFGDVDGDGRDEVGVARRAGVNARYFILEDELSGFSQLNAGGNSWGSNNYATSIAFGDVDGDGRDEVGVARRAGVNARYFILEDELSGFSQLHAGGNSWGSNNYATSIAFGDVDGDGRDEVGVARRAGVNARYFILEDEFGAFSQLQAGGNSWGSNNYATSIAFGDVDGDGSDEIGVARRAGVNARYFIFDT
ncbi:VCBS repeat-containing protein [Moorena producens JHB]|uniref:VCBS repeat-containing protein n=1 Tax=Moorena producens (strain JHB) TaxID=1454205 RepID=A0A9Q9UVQ4_MOOP1|nr:VCBS repeat-containing protein [Moorena producens]WAN69081.1 VCBS repeat-containing protein [Moorena producens JHB]